MSAMAMTEQLASISSGTATAALASRGSADVGERLHGARNVIERREQRLRRLPRRCRRAGRCGGGGSGRREAARRRRCWRAQISSRAISLRISIGSVILASARGLAGGRRRSGASPTTRPLMSRAVTRPRGGIGRGAADHRHGQRIGAARPAASARSEVAGGVGIDDDGRCRLCSPRSAAKASASDRRRRRRARRRRRMAPRPRRRRAPAASSARFGRPRPRLQRVEALAGSRRIRPAQATGWPARRSPAARSAGRRLRPAARCDGRCRSVAVQPGADAQPLSTTISSGPAPGATSAVGLNTGPASATMTSGGQQQAERRQPPGAGRRLLVLARRCSSSRRVGGKRSSRGFGGIRRRTVPDHRQRGERDQHADIGEGEGAHAARPAKAAPLARLWRSASRACSASSGSVAGRSVRWTMKVQSSRRQSVVRRSRSAASRFW